MKIESVNIIDLSDISCIRSSKIIRTVKVPIVHEEIPDIDPTKMEWVTGVFRSCPIKKDEYGN